jgi:hypothetical protein
MEKIPKELMKKIEEYKHGYDVDEIEANMKIKFMNFNYNNGYIENLDELLYEFDKKINTENLNLENLNFDDFEFVDQKINFDEYLDTNTFFTNYFKYQIEDKTIHIIGEIHRDIQNSNTTKKLSLDIDKFLNFEIDIALYEKNLNDTYLGSLFYKQLLKRGVNVIEFDMRDKYQIHDETYKNPKELVAILKNEFKPFFYKDYFINLCDKILKETNPSKITHMMFLLGIFVYDMSTFRMILNVEDKNILVYCGSLHATNIAKIIEKYLELISF